MELSNHIELDNFDVEDSCQPNLDKFELKCDARGNAPLYRSIQFLIKETSKTENHLTDETKTYTQQILTTSLGSAAKSERILLSENCSKNTDKI